VSGEGKEGLKKNTGERGKAIAYRTGTRITPLDGSQQAHDGQRSSQALWHTKLQKRKKRRKKKKDCSHLAIFEGGNIKSNWKEDATVIHFLRGGLSETLAWAVRQGKEGEIRVGGKKGPEAADVLTPFHNKIRVEKEERFQVYQSSRLGGGEPLTRREAR